MLDCGLKKRLDFDFFSLFGLKYQLLVVDEFQTFTWKSKQLKVNESMMFSFLFSESSVNDTSSSDFGKKCYHQNVCILNAVFVMAI